MSSFTGAIQSLGHTVDIAGNSLRNLTDENRLLRIHNEEQAFALARLIVAFDVMRMNGRAPEPDPGCAECVLAGPDSVDTVPCAYHFATRVLGR
jgi:hypothetical protein